jgi:hypothetical protein
MADMPIDQLEYWFTKAVEFQERVDAATKIL